MKTISIPEIKFPATTIFVSGHVTPIQFRFPRSKKKRIQKKWGKDPGNFRRLLDDQFEDIEIVGTFN